MTTAAEEGKKGKKKKKKAKKYFRASYAHDASEHSQERAGQKHEQVVRGAFESELWFVKKYTSIFFSIDYCFHAAGFEARQYEKTSTQILYVRELP